MKKTVACLFALLIVNIMCAYISFAADAPRVSDVKIVGNGVVGQEVTASYSYSGESEDASLVEWYTFDEEYNFASNKMRKVHTGKNYTIQDDDAGKFLRVYVTPTDSENNSGKKICSPRFGALADTSSTASVCSADSVGIFGESAKIGSTVSGFYTYIDVSGKEESGSTYKWYRADTYNGSYTPIPDATGLQYTITADDEGKYLKFEVKPSSGNDVFGDSVRGTDYLAVGNLAYGKSAYALSSYNNWYPSEHGFDGNFDTYIYLWQSASATAYIDVDLGEVTKFNKLWFMDANLGTSSFVIKASDNGTDWNEVYTSSEGIGSDKTVTFPPVTARYVKLEMDDWRSVLLRTFEVFYFPNKVAPVLTLNGESTVNIPRGYEYIDEGATATDDEEGDISNKIIVTGLPVNTNVVGEYEIKYEVSDLFDNKSEVVRTVNVLPGVATEGDLVFGKNIQASSFKNESSIENNVADGNIYTVWEPAETDTAPSVEVDFGEIVDVSKIVIKETGNNIQSYRVEGSANGNDYFELLSGSTIGEVLEQEIDVKKVKYLKLSVTSENSLKINSLEAFLSDLGKVKLAAEAINLGVSSLDTVTEDLALPNKGLYNSKITWKTSDVNVINEEGSITRTTSNQTVKLTAKVKINDATYEKDYTVTVLKSDNGGSGSSGGPGGSKVSKHLYDEVVVPVEMQYPTQTEEKKSEIVFDDLDDVEWAKQFITELAAEGVVAGVSENKFEPNRNITREEFVKIIIEALEITSENNEVQFSDVSKDDWFYKYIACAKEKGIIDGIGDGNFGVGNLITRQDMAVIAYRASMAIGKTLPQKNNPTTFEDENEISEYAKNSIYAMQMANVINGYDNKSFLPHNYLTRAEAAKVICILRDCLNQ